ncbi:hypothetical protein C0991_002833 [Blastosporella zonata]|nr:hypothetical protein C0991_002833 [Blastosporella zonata]
MGSARKTPKGKPAPQLRARQTRSSKGRLLTSASPAASTALLTSQLRSLGLYAADTLGDGNCLFRALSDQLHGTPSYHLDLRSQICDFVEKHAERYEPFVEDERGLQVHLRCMREPGTYGGHVELSAFAHLMKRDVKVVQPGLVYVIEWMAFAGSGSPKKQNKYKGYAYEDLEEDGDIENDQDDEEGETIRTRRHRAKDRHNKDKDPPPGDTIYVAYHDWEHFSSIRNLRGPHTGLPYVRETLPPPVPSPSKIKKEKEKDKPASKKKVTLKLASPSPVSRASTPSSLPELTPSPSPSPAPPLLLNLQPIKGGAVDPATVPLPTSRARSTLQATTSRSARFPPSQDYLPAPSQMDICDYPDADADADVDEGSTPGLSPPSSSLSSSSTTSYSNPALPPSSQSHSQSQSQSQSQSHSPSPEPESESSPEPELTRRQIKIQERERARLEGAGGDKPMTRRQRKALGLPKLRSAGAGAGKIVIPGGRFKRAQRGDGDGDGAGEGEGVRGEEGDGEWVRNGTGRVDVRGFRELKI